MSDDARVVRRYESVHGETHVESVTIRRTDDDTYPSGWKYSLHYGEIGGETLLRYDNAHEGAKGHEKHTPSGVEIIEFPGIERLYGRFKHGIDQLPP